jgi:hypothetical protein
VFGADGEGPDIKYAFPPPSARHTHSVTTGALVRDLMARNNAAVIVALPVGPFLCANLTRDNVLS